MIKKDEAQVPATPAAAVESEIAKAVREALAEALPAVAVAIIQAQKGPAVAVNPFPSHEKCPECMQYTRACQKKHVKMVVFPKDAEANADFFPGVFINGVRYLSNHGGHMVVVPEQNNIAEIMQNFERNERETRNGRKRMHNSGNLGFGGSSIQPAGNGWR